MGYPGKGLDMIYLSLLLILWMAYWSAESGASLPWSHKWQDKVDWFSEVPEAIFSLTVAGAATLGWVMILGLTPWWASALFLVSVIITYVGKQSATFAYLTWNTHVNRNPDRQSTLKPVNDFISGLFGWKLGDEGYSWVWASVKGLIMTLPLAGTGAISFPLGHEIGSHARDRLPGDPNMWKELSSGGAIGLSVALFLVLTGVI